MKREALRRRGSGREPLRAERGGVEGGEVEERVMEVVAGVEDATGAFETPRA